MKRLVLFSFILTSFLFANGITQVPVSKYNINWKEQITDKKYKLITISDRFKCKKYLKAGELKTNNYRAKHYIMKNRAICADDVYIAQAKKVKFNFGSLEIVKDGEIIKETSKYIKIKNLDGKIEKIYKDELGQ